MELEWLWQNEGPWVVFCPQGQEKSTVSSISAPRPHPHHWGPQDARIICTSQSIGRYASQHASHQAGRLGEMTSLQLKHLGSSLKTHSRYFQWNPSDYALLSRLHDFKHPLKQQFYGIVSDPDLWDDHKLRLDWTWIGISSVTTCNYQCRSKKQMTCIKIICSFRCCIVLSE